METSDTPKQERLSGRCRLCGKVFTKRGLSRHLIACCGRRPAAVGKGSGANHGILVQVEDRYQPEYWLFLEMGPDADWNDLDRVLRNIWLECCDHLSDFEFPEPRRRRAMYDGFGMEYMEDAEDEESASAPDADSVAATPVGTRWRYHYDYGSTTTLNLTAVAHLAAAPRAPRVRLLARNDPLDLRCGSCGAKATRICSNCYGDLLCTACARRHRCGTERLRPLINSPRTGVCAYDGPSIEP